MCPPAHPPHHLPFRTRRRVEDFDVVFPQVEVDPEVVRERDVQHFVTRRQHFDGPLDEPTVARAAEQYEVVLGPLDEGAVLGVDRDHGPDQVGASSRCSK
jgi:hypothetical protein